MGYTVFEGKCIKVHCSSSTKYNWYQAHNLCREESGVLATPTSLAMNTFIANMVRYALT